MAAMQVFSLEAVAGLSRLRAGTGGTMHQLCKLGQQISDTGSSKQTKPEFSLCLLACFGGRGRRGLRGQKVFFSLCERSIQINLLYFQKYFYHSCPQK